MASSLPVSFAERGRGRASRLSAGAEGDDLQQSARDGDVLHQVDELVLVADRAVEDAAVTTRTRRALRRRRALVTGNEVSAADLEPDRAEVGEMRNGSPTALM
jgi:hypothetical protein